jgi:hypothetical protein
LRNTGTIFLILILSLTTCFFVTSAGRAERIGDPGIHRNILIQLKTTPASGFEMMKLTAVPDFTLYKSGRVIYTNADANSNVKLMNTWLTPKEMTDLLTYINRQGFWRMDENPTNLTLPGMDITTITVRNENTSKTVRVHGYKLAAYQQTLPKGLTNIYSVLSNFRREKASPYKPQSISVYVDQFNGDIPLDSRIIDWGVSEVDLQGIYNDDNIAARNYRQVVLTGEPMTGTIQFLGNQTLYSNRSGYLANLYKQGKLLYNVAYRPHLPGE